MSWEDLTEGASPPLTQCIPDSLPSPERRGSQRLFTLRGKAAVFRGAELGMERAKGMRRGPWREAGSGTEGDRQLGAAARSAPLQGSYEPSSRPRAGVLTGLTPRLSLTDGLGPAKLRDGRSALAGTRVCCCSSPGKSSRDMQYLHGDLLHMTGPRPHSSLCQEGPGAVSGSKTG